MGGDATSAEDRARQVKLLAMDVDGVLTDGAITHGSAAEGLEFELKVFNVHDGVGIGLARSAGIKVIWLTGRRSEAVARRARELRVEVAQGVREKGAALRAIAEEAGLALSEIAYIGDDLNDLPAIRIAGLALAPADAVVAAREAAHHVTEARGGRGAVREAVEFVLRAQGRLEQAQAAFVADLEMGEPQAGSQHQ